MWIRSRRAFSRLIDAPMLEEHVRRAEAWSSGEVCVSVAPFFWGSVERAAERAFVRLGMSNTRLRNGVLFFVVPSRHRLVILGDQGLHAKVDPGFWPALSARVVGRFRHGDFTGGLVEGIDTVGEELARHFPPEGRSDVNELPDAVDFGSPTAPASRSGASTPPTAR